MKYLSTILLVSCLTISSSAFADDSTCTQDLYNLGKCGVHEVVKGAEAVKNDLTPPVKTAKLEFETGGDLVVDGLVHLQKAGKAIAKPWETDFDNVKTSNGHDENEKNQDLAHFVGDAGKATGQSVEVIGKGIWRGLRALGGGIKHGSAVLLQNEKDGFAKHPEDLESAVKDAGVGTKYALVDMGHGIKTLFEKGKKGWQAKQQYIEQQKNGPSVADKDAAMLADRKDAKQGDRRPADQDLNGTPEPAPADGAPLANAAPAVEPEAAPQH